MTYTAPDTGQIRFPSLHGGQSVNSGLAIHEDDGGKPLCNDSMRPFEGHRADFHSLGAGQVNCGNCARSREKRDREAMSV